jgi:hypothetical protein
VLDFEAILDFSPSLKVMISVLDRGVVRLLSPINMSSKRSARTSTGSAGYKDFNKGILSVAHIWSHIKKGNRVKHQDLEAVSRLLVRERSLE